jgi:polygalacturonase
MNASPERVPGTNHSNEQSLSRRNWLGMVSTASIGAGLLATTGKAAETPGAAPGNLVGARVYNIRDFGAKGDGTTLDTAALQAAIDACHKDQGGTVLVPAGVFVIGTVELKSNLTLHIAAGGKLLGSPDGKQYYAAEAVPLSGDSTLGDGNVGLLFAVKADNITVEGPGTIDGNGGQFRSPEPGKPPPSGRGGSGRPYHLMLYQCTNIIVRDVYLFACAFHSLRIIQCTYAKFEGVRIFNHVINNNDGFHFISSRHVHISNCTVVCQDDACALFGSCQFVTVTNCTFSTRWSVFRFGGGQAENITVSNCLIYETYGCPIKIHCTPNSRFENMSFANLIMKDVTGPIYIGAGAGRRSGQSAGSPDTRVPGVVRNISFSNISGNVVAEVKQFPDVPFTSHIYPGEERSCIVLTASDGGVVENIRFSDIHFTFEGGGTAEEAAIRNPPQVVGEYFSIGPRPAYAMYARNVRGLSLNNVRFEFSKPDARPAMVFDHVQDATVGGFSAQGSKEAESLLRFIESRDVLLSAARLLAPAAVFLQVEGAGSDAILVDGGDLSKAGKPLAFQNGGEEKAVRVRG